MEETLLSSSEITEITDQPIEPWDPIVDPDIANLKENKKWFSRRSNSGPAILTGLQGAISDSADSRTPREEDSRRTDIIHQAFIGVMLYAIMGIVIYTTTGSFKGHTTSNPVDALYFTVVTLCTIGYGDIVPDTTFTKLFTCAFILIGFGFVDFLLNGLVNYICDKQEEIMLTTTDDNRFNTVFQRYMIDKEKGRMRIRTKVVWALFVVVVCLTVGVFAIHFLEDQNWVDSFYLSVTSVTTVGYGDYSFTTKKGRCFAIVWLLVSTFAVAKSFLYLTKYRVDKRNRRIANLVLQKKITLGDLVAADLDKDGSISKSEFVIYKLKEMKRITDKEIQLIRAQFDLLDKGNCGKITLADLIGSV